MVDFMAVAEACKAMVCPTPALKQGTCDGYGISAEGGLNFYIRRTISPKIFFFFLLWGGMSFTSQLTAKSFEQNTGLTPPT